MGILTNFKLTTLVIVMPCSWYKFNSISK